MPETRARAQARTHALTHANQNQIKSQLIHLVADESIIIIIPGRLIIRHMPAAGFDYLIEYCKCSGGGRERARASLSSPSRDSPVRAPLRMINKMMTMLRVRACVRACALHVCVCVHTCVRHSELMKRIKCTHAYKLQLYSHLCTTYTRFSLPCAVPRRVYATNTKTAPTRRHTHTHTPHVYTCS